MAAIGTRTIRAVRASLIVAAAALSLPAIAFAQSFTGGPFVVPAAADSSNSPTRIVVPITVTTASAIKSISIPLGFRGNPEFEFVTQSGCVIDGVTVNAAGTVCTVTFRFAPLGPGRRMGQVQVADGAGNVTNLGISGTGFFPQVAILPGLTSVIGGNGSAGFTGDGSSATLATLRAPHGVVVDAFGNTYIADTANNVVRLLDAFGNITTIAGNNTAGFSGDGGAATSAQLRAPGWLAVDSAQNLYIADTGNNVVRKVTLSTGIITTIAGSGAADFTGDGGAATVAALNAPQGIVVDPAGNLYVVDGGNARVRRVDASTQIITTIAGGSTSVFSTSPADAVSASFSNPTGLAIDATGNLYVADTGNEAVREITGGTVITVAGTGVAGSSGDGGLATSALLASPTGLALNAAGDIYIADSSNNTVRRVEVSSGIIHLYVGSSVAGYSGAVAPSNKTALAGPFGLAFDVAQNLIVADTGDNVVRRVSSGSGEVAFTALNAGAISAAYPITIANIGTASLNFPAQPLTFADPTSAANYSLVTSACAGVLAPGTHCTFTVDYTPQASVFTAGTLLATDDSLTPGILTATQPLYLLGGAVPTLTLSPVTLPDAALNKAYSVVLTAAGGFGALSFDLAGALPPGITATYSATTVTLDGTPTTAGAYPFEVFVTDALGTTLSQPLSLTVSDNAPPLLVSYSEVIQVTDAPTLYPTLMVTYAESVKVTDAPTLYPTLMVSYAEAIQITDTPTLYPTLMVSYPESIQVTDAPILYPTLAVTYSETIQVTDTPNTTVLTSLALSPGMGAIASTVYGTPYSAAFTAHNTTGAYSYSFGGTLPAGLTFATSGASVTLSGTPHATGTFNFSITVNDNAGSTPYTGNFSITIAPAPLTITATSVSRVFDGFNPILRFQATGFVNGDGTAILTGAPTESTTATSISPAGTYPIRISAGTLAAPNYTLSFVNGTLTVTGSANQSVMFGALPALRRTSKMLLTAVATSGLPVNYTVTGPATIAGAQLTINGPGTVSVTATQPGNAQYAAAPPVTRSVIVP